MNPILLLAFLWQLTGTVPSLNSGTSHPCTLGCRDTSAGGPTLDVAGLEVWRQRQSPTYVAHRAAILASPDSAAKYWPTVRTEAAWLFVTASTTSAAQEGAPFAIALPDTMALGWLYAVTALDTVGNRSCISNEVWR